MASADPSKPSSPNRARRADIRSLVVPVVAAATAIAAIAAMLAGCGGIGLGSDSVNGQGGSAPFGNAGASSDASVGAFVSSDAATGSTVANPNMGRSPLCNLGTGTGCEPDLTTATTTCTNVPIDSGTLPPAPDGGADGGLPESGTAYDGSIAIDATGPDLGCHVARAADTSIAPVCSAAGIGIDTSPCLNGASCAAGFECIGTTGQCRRYCCDSTTCDNAQFCDIQPMFGNHDSLNVPVCMPIATCQLFGACDKPTDTCAVVNESTGQTSCVAIGPRNANEECETDHCALNLTCLGSAGLRKCHKLCHVERTDECATGEQCRGNSMTFKDNVGVCTTIVP